MGDVIEFRPAAANTKPRRPASAASVECQILLYTGVRYERHASADADFAAPQPSGTSTKPRVGTKRRKKQA